VYLGGRRLEETDYRIDLANRLEQHGQAHCDETRDLHRVVPGSGHERRRRQVVDLARLDAAHEVGDSGPVEQIDIAPVDPANLVAAAGQQLGEIRAVLARGSGHDRARRAQCKPRTYDHASLRPSERAVRITKAYATTPRPAAAAGERARESPPKVSAAVPPTTSA